MSDLATLFLMSFAIPGLIWFVFVFFVGIFRRLDQLDPSDIMILMIVTLCAGAALRILTQ